MAKLKIISLSIATISAVLGQNVECDPSSCQLPACKCPSRDPPVQNPPQFLLLTFDDAVIASTYTNANNLFQNRRNPNGCPARTTFYTQVVESDPYLVTQWHARGNEVADHSVTHSSPSTHSYNEIEGMRRWAATFAGINRGKIQGIRFPFLNYSAEALDRLSKMGFLYDSSMSSYPSENHWPYTLDNGPVSDCLGILSLCNKGVKAKGVWEIPMNTIQGPSGILLMDPFDFASPANVSTAYRDAFDRAYRGTRVPFGVWLHPVKVGADRQANFDAINGFLNYAMSQRDVWMVTSTQLIEYMKNPVPASQLGSQPYMQCPSPPTNICNGLGPDNLVETCNVDGRAFRTCYGCPSTMPSLADPAPERRTERCLPPNTCDNRWWDPIACRCLCNSADCGFLDGSRPLQDEKSFTPGDGSQVFKNSNDTAPVNDKAKKQQSASISQHPIAQAIVLAALLVASIYMF